MGTRTRYQGATLTILPRDVQNPEAGNMNLNPGRSHLALSTTCAWQGGASHLHGGAVLKAEGLELDGQDEPEYECSIPGSKGGRTRRMMRGDR